MEIFFKFYPLTRHFNCFYCFSLLGISRLSKLTETVGVFALTEINNKLDVNILQNSLLNTQHTESLAFIWREIAPLNFFKCLSLSRIFQK